MKHEIRIVPFQKEHQTGIDTMMENMMLEFQEPIFTSASKKIIDVFTLPDHKFWVASIGNNVVGTIGLVQLINGNIVMKSMFVDQKYRGEGVSNLLLATLTNWAIQNNYKRIYLGTMSQFAAGQRFYEKNEFTRCSKTALPADLIINPLDTIFYTKTLEKD